MEKYEQDIIEEMHGVQEIQDPEARRDAAFKRYSQMTQLQRKEFDIRLGRRLTEAANKAPKTQFSPPTWSLSIVAVIIFSLCGAAMFVVFGTHNGLFIKVIAGVLGLI